jgi:hypothetical protein
MKRRVPRSTIEGRNIEDTEVIIQEAANKLAGVVSRKIWKTDNERQSQSVVLQREEAKRQTMTAVLQSGRPEQRSRKRIQEYSGS